MKPITSEDVAAWLNEQVAELCKVHEYAAVTVAVRRLGNFKPLPEFSIYISKEINSGDTPCSTYAECLGNITNASALPYYPKTPNQK